jgi:Rod binding domain-containing protein
LIAVQPGLREACVQFEAVMLHPLLETMRLGRTSHLTTEQDGEDDGAAGSGDVMQAVFTDAFALALARAGGLGLGRELARVVTSHRT